MKHRTPDKLPRSLKDKSMLWVHYRGRIYKIDTKPQAARATGETASAELIAPFTCKVAKVHVQAGQSVVEGQPIVSVEAMKMEYTYTSPRAGIIREVAVKEGQVVQEGTQFIQWQDTNET